MTTTHLAVPLGRPSLGRRCIVCTGAAAPLLVCERCGQPVHDACYLRGATAPEVAWLLRHDDDADEGLPAGRAGYVVLCPVCRS